MSARWKAEDLVLTRSQNVDRFKRNFLKQAVCELRFPTLMELGEQRPPSSFVKALRKDYPHLELNNEVTFGIGGGNAGSSNIHIFRSSKMNWSVSLKQNALSIETTSYSGFDNLRERILQIIDAAEIIIDSDFFTRIGLRYINVVKSGDEEVTKWINPLLTNPITSESFRGINEFSGRIQLMAEDGGCLLQHGIQLNNPTPDTPPKPDYLIDIDTYRSEVSLSNTATSIDIMHRQAFDIFDWTLTDRARDFLSEDTKTRKGTN
jgi:uncharacterized protein (TIGR04255 family)